MALNDDILEFCAKFAKELSDDNVAIFAGAGLSATVGFVDWRGLLRAFAKELGLDVDRESDHLVRLAQYSVNHRKGRDHLDAALISAFPILTTPSVNHRILARLPISTYWTTNYDRLIENSIRDMKRCVDVKHLDEQLPQVTPGREAVLYKMHGDVEHPQTAVLTRDDYESYALERPGFLNALAGDLTTKTFLFLGFSFTDPNMDSVLSQLRLRYRSSRRQHYCLMKKPKQSDYKSHDEFRYAKAKHQHFVGDLANYGIKVLLLDAYSEVTTVLETIERLYRRRTVFVSGSAADYTPWSDAASKAFFRKLGSDLIDRGFRLVSGLGLGVGDALLSGAIERVHDLGHSHLYRYIEIRPFPRDFSNPAKQREVWRSYREEMISRAGIAVFLFGNKHTSTGNVPASGMLEEFDIALSKSVVPLPVGATGNVARDLADRMLKSPSSKFSKVNLRGVRKLKSVPKKGGLSALSSPLMDSLAKIASE